MPPVQFGRHPDFREETVFPVAVEDDLTVIARGATRDVVGQNHGYRSSVGILDSDLIRTCDHCVLASGKSFPGYGEVERDTGLNTTRLGISRDHGQCDCQQRLATTKNICFRFLLFVCPARGATGPLAAFSGERPSRIRQSGITMDDRDLAEDQM